MSRDLGNFEGKMKWHYFLGFFWMWLVAYGQFRDFQLATSDNFFKSDDPQSQRFIDEMLIRNQGFKGAVTRYGYICLVVCVIAVVAGIGLLVFKKFGPYGVIGLYLLNLLNNAVYVSQYQKVVDSYPNASGVNLAIASGMTTGVLFSLVFIVLNIIYFMKRLHLYD